jgi:putative NADH-flavin reductase
MRRRVKVTVIGASGWLGGTIAREAIERGHDVTAVGRNAERLSSIEGARQVVADLDDDRSLVEAVAGSDVVVAAVTDRSTEDRSRIPEAARTLLRVLPEAGVDRLAFVSGGGSLEIAPGVRTVDAPGFPAEYRNEALAQAEALEILRASHSVEWTYMSPPPHHLVPGEKTGVYRTAAGDSPVINDEGEARITSGDFASAFVDEIENNHFARRRFTAGS